MAEYRYGFEGSALEVKTNEVVIVMAESFREMGCLFPLSVLRGPFKSTWLVIEKTEGGGEHANPYWIITIDYKKGEASVVKNTDGSEKEITNPQEIVEEVIKIGRALFPASDNFQLS